MGSDSIDLFKDAGVNAVVFPIIGLQTMMYVVSSNSTSNGIGGTLTTNHTYGGLKLDTKGRGMFGFRWKQAERQRVRSSLVGSIPNVFRNIQTISGTSNQPNPAIYFWQYIHILHLA